MQSIIENTHLFLRTSFFFCFPSLSFVQFELRFPIQSSFITQSCFRLTTFCELVRGYLVLFISILKVLINLLVSACHLTFYMLIGFLFLCSMPLLQVLALPLPHGPLFPGFYMPIFVKVINSKSPLFTSFYLQCKKLFCYYTSILDDTTFSIVRI